ncbi:MAG: hypothetical protein QM667_04855 [Asticcacaulis sp.]
MTQSDLPKFSFPTPEEMKTATERLTHLWVGACSPLWVPFFAATSFGVSTWMMTGAAARGAVGSDLYKDLPNGFVDMMSLRHSWYKAGEDAAQVLGEVNEAVREAAVAPVMLAIEAEDAVIDAFTETVEAVTPEAVIPVLDEAPVPEAASVEAVGEVPEISEALTADVPDVPVKAPARRRPTPRK